MKKIYLFLGLLSFSATAQNIPNSINGNVTNEAGVGLSGVRVILHHFKLQQNTETNSLGQYYFDTRGLEIDYGAYYYFTFSKPGYSYHKEERLIADARPIKLTKAAVGYLQLKEKGTNKFLLGYRVAIQNGMEQRSNEFGYVTIPLPDDFLDDQEIRISIMGGYDFQDEALKTSKAGLKSKIIDVVMTPLKATYLQLKKKLEESFKDYSQNPDALEPGRQFRLIYDKINDMKLSSAEKNDWWKIKNQYDTAYEVINKILSQQLAKDTVARKYKYETFTQLEKEVQTKTASKDVFEIYDLLFVIGIDILELDRSIYLTNDDFHLFNQDVEWLQKFLEAERKMLYEKKDKMKESLFQSRDSLIIEKADQIKKIVDNF